ncbi:MAG TPA: cysteine synthase A [Deltaproteobacteria bacterium]|nr:cysteine synthase A [Deltaproteobacteria bacterium]
MTTILETIGNTPLLQLGASVPEGHASIYAKLESFNPGGSVKDRICLNMIEAAEARGELQPGATVIEPTSGNTGLGLALVCAVKKYRLILVMPENYSVERRYLLREMGAEIILTSAEEEMPGAIAKVEALAAENPGAFLPRQFSNPDNPDTHRKTTVREILREIPAAEIDAFVAGVGTGGTLTGVASVLKPLHPACLIVAVEPAEAAVLSGKKPKVHKIQGIGPGFVPETLDRKLIDRIETVSDDEAFRYTKLLARREGLLMGISSGAAFVAALRIAQKLGPGKKVVTVFPDKGERYFSIEKYFSVKREE